MTYLEKIYGLVEKEKNLKDKIQLLKDEQYKHEENMTAVRVVFMDEVETNGWVFSLHTHYKELKISFWMDGDDINRCGRFTVKDDCVEMHTIGMYPDNWHEAEALLNKFLFNTGEKS